MLGLSKRLLSFAMILCIAGAAAAHGISGTVKQQANEGGAAIAGAAVGLYDASTGVKVKEGTSAADGTFTLTGVANGNYIMKIVKADLTYLERTLAILGLQGDVNLGIITMKRNFTDDPGPTDVDIDYLASVEPMLAACVVRFDQSVGGQVKHYVGIQPKARCFIAYSNPYFVPGHACSDFNVATNGPNAASKRVTHWHCKYDYGAGPATPDWGQGANLPTWPTVANGKDFWDWAYTGHKTAGGDGATLKECCTRPAFNGRNNNAMRIAAGVWVDSADLFGSDSAAERLWAALATTVFPAEGQPSFAQAKINDNDVAGFSLHVWVLKDPQGGDGNGPARECVWKNEGSGIYTLTHQANPHNCAPKADFGGVAQVVQDKLATVTQHTNTPYFAEDKIKR